MRDFKINKMRDFKINKMGVARSMGVTKKWGEETPFLMVPKF